MVYLIVHHNVTGVCFLKKRPIEKANAHWTYVKPEEKEFKEVIDRVQEAIDASRKKRDEQSNNG